MLAGLNAARLVRGVPPVVPPPTTALGSLVGYVTQPARKDFQPMNANYGLFPPLPQRKKGREKKLELAARALADLAAWQGELAAHGARSSVA
jgi:methylenetetrahydrofolate--tRNA-(uracil-5-)-methyltransferase